MCNFSTETSLLFNEFNEKDIVVVAVTSLRMADFGVGFVVDDLLGFFCAGW